MDSDLNPVSQQLAKMIAQLVAASRASDPEPAGDRLIRWPELRKRVPYCHSRVYALMSQGLFPRARSLGGGRAVAWSAKEIDEWVATRQIAATK
jgi:prophage regulatory protein